MKMQLLLSALLVSASGSVGFAAEPAELPSQAAPKEEAMQHMHGHDSVEQKVMDEVNAMDKKEEAKPAEASAPAKEMNSCRCPGNPPEAPADKAAEPAEKKLELPPAEKIIEPLVQPK